MKFSSKIHLKIYLTLCYIEEILDGINIRKKLLIERLPFYIFNCIFFYIVLSHLDYVYYHAAYDVFRNSNWRFATGLESFNVSSRLWPFVRIEGLLFSFALVLVYNVYFWLSILFPWIFKFVKKNIMMISLTVLFYCMLEFQLFWSYYFSYLFQIDCWAAWPMYFLFFVMFHLLHFAEELEEEIEHTIMTSDSTKTPEEIERDNQLLEEAVKAGEDGDPVFENLRLSGIYDDELFGERPEALAERYDQHMRKWYPEMMEEVKPLKEEEQYVTYNAQGEPTFKYAVDEQLYNIEKLLSEQPKDIRFFYTQKKLWLWALPWFQYLRYSKYKNLTFQKLVYFPMLIQAFIFGGFRKPKVVGPYCIFSPKWKVLAACKDRVEYKNPFLWILIKILRRVYNFFSIFHHINNFKWFLFKIKFLPQLNKLKKKNSKNYVYFKPRKVKQ